MSLVAYGGSDISDSEEENDQDIIKPTSVSSQVPKVSEPNVAKLKLPEPKSTNTVTTYDESNKVQSLLSALPRPRIVNELAAVEEDDEFIKKKETPDIKPPAPPQLKKPVRITLPALSEYEDVEDAKPAPVKQVSKTAGLLGMLPAPKLSTLTQKRAFIPHVLTKKPTKPPPAKVVPKLPPAAVKPKAVSSLINYDSSDDSDNDASNKEGSNNDFFSLNDDYKLPDIQFNEELDNKKEVESVPRPNFYEEMPVDKETFDEYVQQAAEFEHEEELGLDEEALRVLCGSRAKRAKRDQIQIIDVDGKDVLPNREEWLRTALTESTVPMRSHSNKTTLGGPSSQSKRKHQITYLAHQAKANELDLQNQWANNRMTRKQTQSKYGF